MRNPIHYLLVNLAVADMVSSIFHTTELVYSHIDTHPDGTAGKAVCMLRNGTLQWIGSAASVFTVVAIAVERYFAVIYPHGNKGNLSMQKVKIVMISSWIFATFVTIPVFAMVIYKKDINFCSGPEEWVDKLVALLWCSFTMICSALIAGLYSRVVYALWFKRQENNALSPQQQGVLKVRKRVTLMVFSVSALLGVSWFIDSTIHLTLYFDSYSLGPYAIPIAHTVLVFNAAVNPFAYALISRQFRAQMKEILFCASCSTSCRTLSSWNPRDVELANQSSQSTEGKSISTE